MSYTNLEHLKVNKKENVLWLSLDNADMANAITTPMIESLCDTLKQADSDNEIKVIVLSGEGKHFCAGGDVKAMKEKTGMFAGDSKELADNYRKGIQRIPLTIEALKTPIIAMVNGAAIGAGCDLACMCDMRVASDKSKFGETFAKLGLVPGDGGTFFLSRVVGYAKAMELSLTAKALSAQEALDIGLVNTVVSHDNLKEETEKLALKIGEQSSLALSYTKKSLKQAQRDNLSNTLDTLADYQGICQRDPEHFDRLKNL